MRYDFHADPGHGWLAVPVAELKRLGIKDKISRYSYMARDGKTAYLEEDCDYAVFVAAKRKAGEPVDVTEHHVNGESFIRRLPRYPEAPGYDWRTAQKRAAA